MSKVATVLGFGSQSPAIVLEILSQAVTEHGIANIDPVRSQSMQLALAKAPYRVFTDSVMQKESSQSLYCLPSVSPVPYGESNARVRRSLEGVDTVVACYNL
jgi:hypothetical protein